MEEKTRHICPKCGYEYEPWIEICPDCGVLVETLVASDDKLRSVVGGLDPNEDPRWTIVTNVPNAIIGSLIKNQLEDAGIPVFMQRSPSADIAYFSHNDFVPHDLRVPFHLVEEARRILDSRPDRSPGAPYWGTDLEDEEEDEEAGAYEDSGQSTTTWGVPPGNLPEGWTLLPTERDLRAGRRHRQAGDPDGWYRLDSGSASTSGSRGTAAEETEYDFDEEPLETDKARFSAPDDRDYYGDSYGYSGRRKWIGVIYAILLLVMSLPFLLNLMEQIASFFSGGR